MIDERPQEAPVDLTLSDLGRMDRMEAAFRQLEHREAAWRLKFGILPDGISGRCFGCGRTRHLWHLELVRVPDGELEPGSPARLRYLCLDHGVPAVRVPAREWRRPKRDAEAMATITAAARAEAARGVPEELTVGFWRRTTGRRGKAREA